jgi:hypothetical protein
MRLIDKDQGFLRKNWSAKKRISCVLNIRRKAIRPYSTNKDKEVRGLKGNY